LSDVLTATLTKTEKLCDDFLLQLFQQDCVSKEGHEHMNIHCFIAPLGTFLKAYIYFIVGRDINLP